MRYHISIPLKIELVIWAVNIFSPTIPFFFWEELEVDDNDKEYLAHSEMCNERLREVGVGPGGEESKDLKTSSRMRIHT